MSQHELLLTNRTSQVQIAPLHPDIFRDLELVINLKGRRLGRVEHVDRIRLDFHHAGGQLRVLRALGSRADGARDLQHVLRPKPFRPLVEVGVGLRVEDHLGQA